MQRVPSIEESFDPVVLRVSTGAGRLHRIAKFEERLDQRLERLGAGLERQEAPTTAVVERLVATHSARGRLWPSLALERRKHARLRQGGFPDTGIAEKNGELVRAPQAP